MYSTISPTIGTQPQADFYTTTTTQQQVLGMEITAVDPYWGQGTFVYLKSGATISKGNLVQWDETYTAALLVNTANTGYPCAVAMGGTDTTGIYFWAQVCGRAVYVTTATVAADAAIGISGAGTLGANSAGKQILGIRNRVSATGTVTGTANTYNGTNVLYFPKGYDGFFLGAALTGTGVGASAVVAGMDPDGKRLYTGTAIGTLSGANQTATGSVTVTGTYTGYGSGIINRPFVQGAIT